MVRSIYDNAADASATEGTHKTASTAGLASQVNTRIERGFMGAHADIGGGYITGDMSDVSLMWMVDQAKKAGVTIDDTLVNSRGYNVVSEPVMRSVEKSIIFNLGG